MTEAQLRYLVEVQDRDLRELQKNVKATNEVLGKGTEEAGQKASRGFGIAKKAALGLGIGLATGLFAIAKVGWGDFAEGQKVAAQTTNVIKSTGGAANVTAGQVDKLASSISNMSGIDDEAVKAGENMLLTFTNVRNEAGRGNDIFNQSTAILTDMSVALGTDMSKQAIQLGKALNDPIKGVSALSRVGVTFTAGQKETIKSLVESGNTMGAQKLILAELNREFGGSAKAAGETLPGQLARAKVAFENVAGTLVGAVVPSLADGATWLSARLPAALAIVERAAEHIGPVVKVIFGGIRDVIVDVFRKIGPWIEEHRADLVTIGNAMKTLGTAAVFVFRTVIVPAAKFLFGEVLPQQIGIAVAVIAGIIRTIGAVKTAAVTAFGWLRDNVGPYVQQAANAASTAFSAIKTAIGAVKTALDAVADGIRWLRDTAGAAIERFRDKARPAVVAIRDVVAALGEGLERVQGVFKWLRDNAGNLVNKLGPLTDILGKVGGFLGKIPGVGDVAAGFNSAIANAKRASIASSAGSSSGLAPSARALLSTIQAMFGNVFLSSGFRTPAQNERAGGAPNSDHLSGKALDLVPASGWNPATVALFDRIASWAASLPGVRWIGWRGVPGHGPYDHLHLSTYDRGGVLDPGYTLAYNGTGSREFVLPNGSALVDVLAAALAEVGGRDRGPLVQTGDVYVRGEDDIERIGAAVSRAYGIA